MWPAGGPHCSVEQRGDDVIRMVSWLSEGPIALYLLYSLFLVLLQARDICCVYFTHAQYVSDDTTAI